MKRTVRFFVLTAISLLLAISIIACTENEQTLPCDHSNDKWTVVTEATCLEDGLKKQFCVDTDELLDSATIPALGHDNGSWVVVTAAGCESAGLKELRCTRDGHVLDSEVIQATDHDYQESTTTATCTAAGTKTFVCSHDSTHTYDEPIAALGHDNGSWVVVTAAGCESAGLKELRCTRDGHVLDSEVIQATDHDYQESTTTATCTAAGTKTFVCSHDSTHTYDEPIAALGHDSGSWVVVTAAGCESAGFKELRCTRDGHVLDSEVIPAKGHDYQENTKAATCTADGKKTFVCSHDSTHTYEESIPALGHDSGSWVVVTAAGCESAGFKELRCTRDGHVLDSEVIQASGHDYGDWVMHSAATSSRPEQQKRVCRNTAGCTETRYYAPELTLGVASDVEMITLTGKWYTLHIEEATMLQIGYLQTTSSSSLRFETYLYTSQFVRISAASNGHSVKCAIAEVSEGTYYVMIAHYGGGENGRVRVDDFNALKSSAATIELDNYSADIVVDNIGTWLKLEVANNTLAQIAGRNAQSGTYSELYSENNFTTRLLGTNPFETTTTLLETGIYYLRIHNTSSGMGSASIKIIDLTTTTQHAPNLALSTLTQSETGNTEGRWYKFNFSQKTHVRFLFTSTGLSLVAKIHLADEILTEFAEIRQNGGSAHVVTLPAGNYFIRIFSTSGEAGTVEAVDWSSTLAAATVLQLDTPVAISGLRSAGQWFKLNLIQKTDIKIAVNATTSYLHASVFKADDLNATGLLHNEAGTLAAGNYYIFVTGSDNNPSAGTLEIVNLVDELSSAHTIVLGDDNQINLTTTTEFVWLKLVLTSKTQIKLTYTPQRGYVTVILFSANDLSSYVNSVGGSNVQVSSSILEAGTYYFRCSSHVSGGGAGNLLVELYA